MNAVAQAIAQAWPAGAAHAFLPPSSAFRWVVCAGSARMEAQYPEQGDKTAAEEGTAAHWVFAQLMDGWTPEQLLADGKTESGHIVTREMIDGAQMLYDDVCETLHAHGLTRAHAVVEKRVNIPRVHPSANWGTPDVRVWITLPDGSVLLFVWDFKYGHGYVEVYENLQLVDYAAGILDERRDVPEDRITVVFRIVQPRCYHKDGPVREWRVPAPGLAPYVFRLAMAADDAMSATAECKPQAAACENCSARHACDALQRAAYRGMDLSRQAQASDLPIAALGLEARYLRDAAKLMDARLTGLTSQIETLQRMGQSVPHWKMESGGARKVWRVPDAEAIAAGEMLGVKLAKAPEAVTPTQALKAGFPASLLGVYAFNPPGAVKLVVDDGSDARRTFT